MITHTSPNLTEQFMINKGVLNGDRASVEFSKAITITAPKLSTHHRQS